MDERNVRHLRHRPPHRAVDLALPRRIGQVIDAADDMGYRHVVIVDDDRQIVGRIVVRSQNYEIVEIAVLEYHLALDGILNDRFALLWSFEPDRRFDAGRRFGGFAVAPRPVIAYRALLGLRLGAHRVQLLRRAIAAIGMSGSKQRLDDLAMSSNARILRDRLAIPIETEPF
jgi:hypothetical protein